MMLLTGTREEIWETIVPQYYFKVRGGLDFEWNANDPDKLDRLRACMNRHRMWCFEQFGPTTTNGMMLRYGPFAVRWIDKEETGIKVGPYWKHDPEKSTYELNTDVPWFHDRKASFFFRSDKDATLFKMFRGYHDTETA